MLKTRKQAVQEILDRAGAKAAQHFDYGGAVGAGAGGALLGPLGAAAGGVGGATQGTNISNAGGSAIGSSGFKPIDAINPIQGARDTNKALTNPDTFVAANPDLSITNFAPQLAAGQAQLNAGNIGVGETAAGLTKNAGNIGALAAQQAPIAQQQQGLMANTANLTSGLTGPGGVLGQQQGLVTQQQGLANLLGQQAMGYGPNPAQQQFQQNLNANTQTAAGTLASAKGLSPALAAELVARQQAAAGQNASGAEATLQAQQQVAAQQALGQQQASIGNTLGQQVGTTNAAAGINQAAAGIGSQASNTLSAGANGYAQAGGLDAQAGNLYQGQANNGLGQIQNATTGQNAQNATVANVANNNNNVNAGVSSGNAKAANQIGGGILNGLGGAAAAAYDGGQISNGPTPLVHQSSASVAAQANPTLSQMLMARGGSVPGQAQVAGNSIKNDTVPAVLSPGEIVLPREVTEGADPAKLAADFVDAIKSHTQPGYAKVLAARKAHEEAVAKYKGGRV